MTEESQQPTFWQKLWRGTKKVLRSLAAPLPAILIVVGAILLVMLGVKNIQIGGLLGKLFGKDPKPGTKAVDVANTVPEDRVDKDGNVIPPGTPDSKGVTQAKVVPIDTGGLFSRDDQVKITPPDSKEPVVVDLPDGVKAKDVDKVIVVKPNVYAVSVKSTSKVTAADVDDLLSKYGS